MVNEDMRDLFFIIKGQYCKKKSLMEMGDNEYYIGAFDPEDYETKEWYRVIDRETGRCIHAGVSLDKALHSVRREIIRNKNLRGYIKSISSFSDKKNQRMMEMEKLIDEEYGYYFRDMIRETENEAYRFLEDNTDIKKAKRRFKRIHTGKESHTEGMVKEASKKKKERKKESTGLVLHKIKPVFR